MSFKDNRTVTGTTPQPLFDPVKARVVLVINTGAVEVRVGSSSVGSTGVPLAAGASLSFENLRQDDVLYGWSATAGQITTLAQGV